ncbi:hypothetical protein [Micromonospora sp. ATA51]|uniref:hypothetical protein n=1 Tax=Micromonospora sp. ATA51 TaxID=2806098 RepID=UPI001A562BA0|nr:hypothetical protein [Micromonospora sp. ATA51]MBM0226464.1 hypothetical protein [Micromonospora sp. ATA51]
MNSLTPAATLAVAALAPFHPTRREAAALLAGWARRDTLTTADVRAVVRTFPAVAGAR